ncbi:hypothetical protein SCARD494_11074 [Seiridium cardinale]
MKKPGDDLRLITPESLIIAGSDTTAIIMSAMFFYLARNPAIREKSVREVLSTFSSPDEIMSGSKLGSCQYLRAFIQDALRMTPPFQPKRWIVDEDGTTAESVELAEAGFCISYESRGCLGKQVAWMEMTIVVANFVFHFEIRADAAKTHAWCRQPERKDWTQDRGSISDV